MRINEAGGNFLLFSLEAPLQVQVSSEKEKREVSLLERTEALHQQALAFLEELRVLPSPIRGFECKKIEKAIQELSARIERCSQELWQKDAQGVVGFFTASLGFGMHASHRLIFAAQAGELQAQWKEYIHSCCYVASQVFKNHDFPQASKMYEELASVLPPQEKCHERLGDTFFALGIIQKALECYEKWDPSLSKYVLRKVIKQARCFLRLGRFQDAYLVLEKYASSCDKDVFIELIRTYSALHRHADAIALSLRGIRLYPIEDAFRLRLIDSYLFLAKKQGFSLLKAQKNLLLHYFSTQTCYLQVCRRESDSLGIIFDFLDYLLTKTQKAYVLWDEFFRPPLHDDLIQIVYTQLLEKEQFFRKKVSEFLQVIEEISAALSLKDDKNEYSFLLFKQRIEILSTELVGNRGAYLQTSLMKYQEIYLIIISAFIREVEKSSSSNAKEMFFHLQRLKNSMECIKKELHELVTRIFDPSRGIRETISKWYNSIYQKIESLYEEESEEISAVEWIKRGNLMNVIAHSFVPFEKREEYTCFLESQGIDIEALFRTPLMSLIPNTPLRVGSRIEALDRFLLERKITTLDALKNYILKPT